jgi:predicted Mrr-cat superfamily restriction endonuclease
MEPDDFSTRGNDIIENLLAHYDHLDEDLRSELPLKRIWTNTNQGEE